MSDLLHYEDAGSSWGDIASHEGAIGVRKSITPSYKSTVWHLELLDGRSIGPVPSKEIPALQLPDLTTEMQYAVMDLLTAKKAAEKAQEALEASPGSEAAAKRSVAAATRLATAKVAFRAAKANSGA